MTCLVVLGCGDGDDTPAYPDNGTDERQIRAVFEFANQAGENRDAGLLCSQVLPPSTLRRSSVAECTDVIGKAMERRPENWGRSDDELENIEVDGDHATADVNGQPIYDFVNEQGRWWMVFFD